ncbi:MAG TPA: glycosyltransferase family 2 protein [Anaeromyxobacteraceae bacterium]|jgi:glycosyltransferase involved in cell wall biosynthesis|nr:glycosyltransferase family 2 protein [Anaeromyxobacteraceae bacterium]
MPLVSIVMPTYNRADTISRAIASIHAQTWKRWELIVVDDGSTDGTADRLAGLDPRLKLIRQANQGVTGARNTGLEAATGDLIAFLDSDDEWLPHHLELAAAFFEAFPGEHVLTGEFWQDFGARSYVKHHLVELESWAPMVARRIGSQAFAGPPPRGDPYLRVFESRERVGEWARPALGRTPYASSFHYRGDIFRGWRWEFLMAMQSTVVTRAALQRVGPTPRRFPVSSDYGWLALLSKHFPVNLVSAPSCIKHEYGDGRRRLAQDHLVTGSTATQFHLELLRQFEELFWAERPQDPELRGIRAYRQFRVADAALSQGRPELALEHLRASVETCPDAEARAMLWLARLVRHPGLSRYVYRASRRAASMPRSLARLVGEATAQ